MRSVDWAGYHADTPIVSSPPRLVSLLCVFALPYFRPFLLLHFLPSRPYKATPDKPSTWLSPDIFAITIIISQNSVLCRALLLSLISVCRPHDCRFLSNVNSRSCSLYAIARPSVVCLFVVCRLSVCLSVCLCLSVTLVHPTQAVQIFGNISTALGTLAIR